MDGITRFDKWRPSMTDTGERKTWICSNCGQPGKLHVDAHCPDDLGVHEPTPEPEYRADLMIEEEEGRDF
jgi:hypothetical protein